MAFSVRAGTNWCHDFPKVARESGFNFNMHRTRVRVDWKRISSIDIERVIEERDFSTIDENVNNIVDCCLESEYDVKILEPNFVKLFRLAQLAVEYLLYCKQYLDQSVMILKDELRSKIEENVKLKKELGAQEEKVRESRDFKTKERSRVVERKLNDSHGEIHKCPQCSKTFISAFFVSAHVSRRHPHSNSQLSAENSPVHKQYLAEAEKLHNEIKSLKERLNQTERVIRNEAEKFGDTDSATSDREKGSSEARLSEGKKASDKDDEQYKRYQQEIRNFKSMLLSEIRNLKLADATRLEKEDTDDCSSENVKDLIRRQEKEIQRLRDQLQKRLTPDIEGIHAKLENQEDFWQSKIDNLEARHRNDIEKLYSQLKVSRESVNEMRLDYMSKINDLEWRSRSDSALIPDRKIQSEIHSLHATRDSDSDDNDGGVAPEESPPPVVNAKENNYLLRGKRQRQDDEQIRVASTKKDKTTLMHTNEDRNKRKIILETRTNNTKVPLRRKSPESFNNQEGMYRLSSISKSNLRSIEKQDLSSLDSGDCTTTNSTTTNNAVQAFDAGNDDVRSEIHDTKQRFLGRASRGSLSAEKRNGVEKTCDLSSEESLDDSEVTEESQTEDSEESGDSVNSTERKLSDYRDKENANQDTIQQKFEFKLRDLGIDPEWQAIPSATFAHIMETIEHERYLKCKKYHKFDEIRHKIIQQVAQTLMTKEKVTRIDYSTKRTPLEKLVTNVKSKASRALKILEKNDGSRRSINSAQPDRPGSNKIKKLSKAGHRISEQATHEEYSSPRAVSRRTPGINNSVESNNDFKHSYESIKDFVRDTNRKLVTSTPQRAERKLILDSVSFTNDTSNVRIANHRDSILSLSGSPKSSSKGVLKSTSASSGSHVKKKVLFDLESGTSPEREKDEIPLESQAKQSNNQPRINNRSSVFEYSRDETDREIGESPQSGSILLKTRQSEKIAQISKQIEKQLSVPREKPAGAVEAMFTDKFSMRRDNDESLVNAYRTSRSNATDNNLPQPAPRLSHLRTSESKDSNLDMDIDELLEIQ